MTPKHPRYWDPAERWGTGPSQQAVPESTVLRELHFTALQNLIDAIAMEAPCECPQGDDAPASLAEACFPCQAMVLSPKWIAKQNAILDAREGWD